VTTVVTFGFVRWAALIVFGVGLQSSGNLSDVLSILRSEAPALTAANQTRTLAIISSYIPEVLGGQGKSLAGEWPSIDAGLTDRNPAVRDRMCTMLALIMYSNQIRPVSVPEATRNALVDLLNEVMLNTRENAARALALMADGVPAAIAPKLIELARTDSAPSVRRIATAALSSVRPPTPIINDFWIQSLGDISNREMRGFVLSSFRTFGPDDPRVVSLVIDALRDNDRFVRQEAIAAITTIGKPASAALPLLTAIKNSDESLRSNAEAAIRALSR
jgi:hypothetical protein